LQHEHLYRLAVEQVANYAIFLIGPSGHVTSWNAGVQHLLQWEQEEWIGQPVSVIFPPEDVAEGDPEAQLLTARQKGSSEDDRWLIRRDGTKFWCSGITTALLSQRGNVSGFLMVMRDLTDWKRAEVRQATHLAVTTVLAEASDLKTALPRLLEAICNVSGWSWGALWGIDNTTGVLRIVKFWNAQSDCRTEFDHISSDISFAPGIGLPGSVWKSGVPNWSADVLLEANFPRREAAVKAGLHGAICFPVGWGGKVLGVMEFFSTEVRRPDESLLEMMAIIGGQIGQFIDRKLTEDRLHSEEAQHAASVKAALDCIVSMDHEGKVTEWNPAAERTFGYARHEVLGREMASLIIPPSYRQAHREGLNRYLATGEGPVLGKRFEITAIRKDGDEFPIELTIIRLPAEGLAAFTGYIRDITEQKRADEARRMSEFRWQRMVEQSPLSTQIFAPDGTVRQVNRAWEQLWGVTLADLPGYNILQDQQLVERGIMSPIRQAFEGEAATAEPIPYMLDRGQYAGQARWCGAYVYPVKDDAGRVEEVVLVHNDVTEQRQAEEATRLGAQRLRSLVEQSAAGIAHTDLTGLILFANERFVQIVGYSMEELLRLRVHDLTHPDDLAETTRSVADGATTGNEYGMEKRYVRKDGSVVWVAVSASIIKDGAGNPQSIMGVVIDISDRKRAEEALRESEERLRLGLIAGNTGTWDWDIVHNVVKWSEQIYMFHAVKPGDFSGRVEDFTPLIHPEDRKRVAAAIQQAVKNQSAYYTEYRAIQPAGSVRWILTTGQVYYDAAGKPTRMLGAASDITAKKEAEAQLREAKEAAELASNAKDRFLAVLSHELRTPLTPVAMAAAAMEVDSRLPFEFREDMGMIRRNIDLETRLIDDLLDLSRVTSGKFQLNPQPINVHRVIRHVLETVGAELHEKQLTMNCSFVAGDDRVLADPARLQQTFWNLLKNAVKFSPVGSLVSISTRNESGQLLVEVADRGKGISPEVLSRIFDPFEQGDAEVTRRYGGMGLGLAIAKAVVDAHGGTITASSEGEGRGATFIISLLLCRDADASSIAKHDKPEPSRNRPLRILLVEDHVDTAKLLTRLLKLDGSDVCWASTIAEALTYSASDTFDVVLSDLGLPDGSGHDLIRQLLRKRPVTGIAMSGYGMEDDIRRSQEAGFIEHLVKPVSMTQLREAIQRAVKFKPG
jgi:PAS domain S-box-containing protein